MSGVNGHAFRIAPETAVSDHRIVGIGVDIHARCEVETDAQIKQLEGQRPRHRLGQRGISGVADAPHRGPLRPGRPQPLDPPTLLIDREEKRRVLRRAGVKRRRELARLFGASNVARKQNDATDAPVGDQPSEVVGYRHAFEPREEQLARLRLR